MSVGRVPEEGRTPSLQARRVVGKGAAALVDHEDVVLGEEVPRRQYRGAEGDLSFEGSQPPW